MGCEGAKTECSRRNFLFSNCKPWELCSPQYRVSWMLIAYAVFKWIGFTFFNSMFWVSLFHVYDDENRPKWLIYLTNWSFTLFNASLLLNAICVTVNLCKRKDQEWQHYLNEGCPTWYLKLNWILYLLSNPANLMITVLFWTVVYSGNPLGITTAITHGANALYSVIIDMFVTAMPIRALQFWLALLYGLMFVLFSLIYDVSGGTSADLEPYIYSVLDWTENAPMAVGFGSIAVVGGVIAFFVIFGLYKLRAFIYIRCCKSEPKDRYEPPTDRPIELEER